MTHTSQVDLGKSLGFFPWKTSLEHGYLFQVFNAYLQLESFSRNLIKLKLNPPLRLITHLCFTSPFILYLNK